ncbi:hypothetical protein NDI56_05945 [Haloarcula sp. S1CR25-12]|uniref:Uncharacterized protein n=1 Tax=Haloarcula saliterrae TaxID=2950534 RepID=A0ABU2FAT4_9EURY|nr:hypothetical protein [Haloarcula sp. S1CR25-12]MDS0258931.1 hypothetical protein [Haloarcula sp. S1CR25-12]
MGLIDQLQNDAYTGENRCSACTAVNTVLALVGAVLVDRTSRPLIGRRRARGLALATLAISGLSIWIRGYLVPKTPELTKEYMPPWMLAWFDKEPFEPDAELADEEREALGDPIDTEEYLLDHGVVTAEADGQDYVMTEEFQSAWEAKLEALEDWPDAESDPDVEPVLDLFQGDWSNDDVESPRLDVDDHRVAIMYPDGTQSLYWPSLTAVEADLVTGAVLQAWDEEWDDLDTYQRAKVFQSVRIFIETCPDGDETVVGEDTVESCCSEHEVATVECTDSGDRLAELPA